MPEVEPFPDALQGPVTKMAADSAAGCKNRAGDGALEEAPQKACGQAQPPDLVRAPDAEGPPAPRACLAVAAKNPPRAQGFVPGAAVVKSIQITVPDQCADNLAMGTRCLLEPLRNRLPFVGTTAKPSLLDHGDHASAKSVILAAWGGEAG